MSQSMRQAFLAALQKKSVVEEKLQKQVEEAGLDYTEVGMRFLNECLKREVMYTIYQGDWYNHLAHGVPRPVLRGYEHYHLGGMVVIRETDTFNLMDWKKRNQMPTEILDKLPTEIPNLYNPHFLAIYTL